MIAVARGAGRMLRGLSATAVTLILLAGIPYALVLFIGWPLPDHLPTSTAELTDWVNRAADDQFIINALAVGLWLAWARFAYWFLIAVIDAIRQGPRHLTDIDWRSAPIKGVAAILVGTILGALLFDLARGMLAGAPATAGPSVLRPAVVAAAEHPRAGVTVQTAALPHRALPVAAASVAAVGAHDTYTVCHGDSLWNIAADKLGDPDEWRAIWVLNRHHTFGDGRTFTQPDIIHPGWVLKLPAALSADTGPAVPTHPQPTQSYLDRHAHDGDETAVTAPVPQLPDDGVVTPSAPTGGQHTPSAQATTDTAESHRSDTSATRITLSSGSWISLGLAAALALAGRLVWVQRRRLYQPKPPAATLRLTDPDAAALPRVVRQVQRNLTASVTPATAAAATADQGQAAAPSFAWPARDWAAVPGAGTAGAARAVLIQALAAGAHDLDERGHVVIPAATLAALLPGTNLQALPPNPRMIVTADLAAALDWCEEQLLHRRRVLISHDVDDADALRDSDPLAEPMPLVTLITQPPAGTEHVRATAILTQGRRVNITATLLATPSDTEDDDATQAPGAGSFTADETVAILHTVTESQTGHRSGLAEPTATDDENADVLGESAATAPELHDGELMGEPDADGDADADLDDAEEPIAGDETLANDEEAAFPPVRVRITVLGAVTIHNPGNRNIDPPIRIPSVELVAYLIANGGEARQTAILEDILPDAPARRARGRLDTLVYSLRRGLSQIGGEQLYLDHPKHRYVLNPDALDVDVWQIRDVLARAEKAGSPDERVAALREAIALYVAPFAGDLPYEWKEKYVFAFSRQILDARVALAEALEHHSPSEALDVVLAAVAQDPKAEAPVRLAMTMHARLGNADAIRDLRRAIVRSLEDDGLEPSDELRAHAEQLLIQAGKKRPARSR